MPVNLSEAEVFLLAWGAYMRGNEHLGYPHCNTIGRIMAEGCGASHTTVKTEPHMGAVVELVENCLLQLPRRFQQICKYRFIGLEPPEITSRKLKISLDVYETRVNQVIQEVAEFIAIN